MAFDLTDEELQATREMNKTSWKSEINKWSRKYLIERYKDLVEIEKEHKKENGELRKENKRLRYMMNNSYLLDYIPIKDIEDKIKEKIIEKENVPNEIDFKAFYRLTDLKNIEIQILQELIERND